MAWEGQRLAALSPSTPEARRGRAWARGVDGGSADRAIMATAMMRYAVTSQSDPLGVCWINPGGNDVATPRQPERPEVVTHVLGTFCYLCVRAGHNFMLVGEVGLEPTKS